MDNNLVILFGSLTKFLMQQNLLDHKSAPLLVRNKKLRQGPIHCQDW